MSLLQKSPIKKTIFYKRDVCFHIDSMHIGCILSVHVQGGEDAYDALSLEVVFHKRAL